MVSTIPAVYDPRAMPRGRSTYNQDEPEPGTFGYCVFYRRWRVLGVTQEELAARVRELGGKVKQGDISDLEHGKVGEPRRPRMRLFAQALRVSVDTLYAWRDNPDQMARMHVVAEERPMDDPARRAFHEESADLTPDEMARMTQVMQRIKAEREALAKQREPERN